MLAAVWLMLSSLLYSLQLSTGSFPKPLTQEQEEYYLALSYHLRVGQCHHLCHDRGLARASVRFSDVHHSHLVDGALAAGG